MKLFLTASLLFLPIVLSQNCGNQDTQVDCEGTNGCFWHGPGGCSGSEDLCPHDANNANSCEGDAELCIFSNNGGGVKTCNEANKGYGVNGTACKMHLTDEGDEPDLWVEVEGEGCAAGFICEFKDQFDMESVGYGQEIEGTCRSTECIGKKVPGNCNGNIEKKDQCDAMTERVTICHRTCSAKNPWVRITIDEDAWNGEGCGHQNHEVEVECKNKAPWFEWGPNRRDYMLKWHGTREQVRVNNGWTSNSQEDRALEKAYWRKWEPACPYVRNGHCCNWEDVDNPCCGIHPDTVEIPVPEIEIRKTSKDNDSPCTANNMGEELAVAGVGHERMKYCYFIQNHGNLDLCEVEMSDPSSWMPVDKTPVGPGGCLKKGESVIIDGQPFANPDSGEHTDATVKGIGYEKGVSTNMEVTASDPSAVAPAVLTLEKKCRIAMGPGTDCSAENAGVETAVGKTGIAFECCYKITNESGNAPDGTPINVCGVNMSDNASSGGMATQAARFTNEGISAAAECFAMGESVWYKGPEFELEDGSDTDSGTAEVSGTTEIGGNPVGDDDDAGVVVGDITLQKSCKVADGKPCSETAGDELAVDEENTDMQCCYKIKNPKTVPVCELVLNDSEASTGGMVTDGAKITGKTVTGDMTDGCLDGGSEVWVTNPNPFPNPPHKDDGPAKIRGWPKGNPAIVLEDTSSAGVSPASINIVKTCKVVDNNPACTAYPGDEMAVGKPGDNMKCCYKITNNSPVDICDVRLNDNDLQGASGMVTDAAQIVGKTISSGGNMANGCLPAVTGEVMVDGDPFTNPGQTEIGTATVDGLPDGAEDRVDAEDPAGVSMANIEIIKYAKDNNNACSATDFGDDISVEAPVDTPMKYCYKITNIGKFKLCEVIMKDLNIDAPLLGSVSTNPHTLGLGTGATSMTGGCLEVDESVWAESEEFPNPRSGEGPKDAEVTGVPEGETSPVVEDSDPAAVSAILCPNAGLMGSELATVCENKGVVVLGQHPKYDSSQNLPPELEADDLKNLFFNIEMQSTDDSVQFSVKNPFKGSVDMYVQYRTGYDDTCVGDQNVASCGQAVEDVVAVCDDVKHINPSATNFAVVTVFFVEKSGSWTINDSATVDPCCEANVPSNSNVLSYTFEILCACPGQTSTTRVLRA